MTLGGENIKYIIHMINTSWNEQTWKDIKALSLITQEQQQIYHISTIQVVDTNSLLLKIISH